jgi:aryl-alcohol dehydrogenase-like predicted oxidoreductase
MKRSTLGRTGLEVTQLGFGAMELRGAKSNGREITDAQAQRILNAVLDSGINFIDTSPDYGTSEELIGRLLSHRRREFFLATKCGCNPAERNHIWTREHLLQNIRTSLERMKTDHVDILQLHNPKPEDVRAGGLVEVLRDIQAKGLTRYISTSTTLPHLSEFLAMGVFDTMQIPYSCLQPEHHEAITQAAQKGTGIIIRGGIGMGGPGSAVPHRVPIQVWEKAGLAELCGDMEPAELILRHTLSHPYCHTTIVGTLNPDHLAKNLQAANKGPLPADLYAEIRRRVAAALAT